MKRPSKKLTEEPKKKQKNPLENITTDLNTEAWCMVIRPNNGITHMILIVLAVQIVPFILQANLIMKLEPKKRRRKKLPTLGTNLQQRILALIINQGGLNI